MDNEACFLSDIKIILSDIKIIERLTIVSALFINVLSKHTGYDSGDSCLPTLFNHHACPSVNVGFDAILDATKHIV